MTIQKVGYLLIQIGGFAVIAGLLMVKFPQIFSQLGKLPGDINIGNRVHLLLGTSIALSIGLTLLSMLVAFLSRFFR